MDSPQQCVDLIEKAVGPTTAIGVTKHDAFLTKSERYFHHGLGGLSSIWKHFLTFRPEVQAVQIVTCAGGSRILLYSSFMFIRAGTP